ncbi:FtsK/SpoIIIE family DNA translocase [Urinicoccus massiliensis]|uniref:FtsK/SpoIIIE family DNA translocase n=1 Tax=Urinicoccus massiliensis TaxID=1723382 RepID=UPI000930AC15|nr:DNA translocase FtsK [Urinicoccus massiliensis]
MARKSNKKAPKRKNKKNRQVDFSFTKSDLEMLGLFLIVLSILSIISLFSENMGIFGDILNRILIVLGGRGRALLAIYLGVIGLMLAINEYGFSKRRLILLISWFIMSLLIYYEAKDVSTFSMLEKAQFILGQSAPIYGGLIGVFFGSFFYKIFGSTGTAIVLSIVFIVLFLYFLPFSLKSLFTYLKLKSDQRNQDRAIRKKEKEKRDKIKANKIKKQAKIEPEKKEFTLKRDTELEINDYAKKEEEEVVQKVSPLTKSEIKDFEKEVALNETMTQYTFPPKSLLNPPKKSKGIGQNAMRHQAQVIEETMNEFNIECQVVAINRGPVITCYELQIAPGVKLNKIVSLQDNLALALASSDIRIEAPIPGKSAVGIEVPNEEKDSVSFSEILDSPGFKKSTTTPLALGKDVSGEIVVSSIDKMPHLLIAGATGSGKSVCINTIITSILYRSRPDEVKLILIDPKVVELSVYNGIPHLLIPVVTDPKKAAFALKWAVDEMEKRYKLFAQEKARDMKSYNLKMQEENRLSEIMPKIIVIVDELADLMMVAANEIEDYIARLAQMARAAGIHMILATQRPSVDVITGTIKANIPSRIAFAVSSGVDSRTILDSNGAEALLGQGDMLFYPSFYSKPRRLQGAFISDKEVEAVISFIRDSSGKDYDQEAVEAIEKTINTSVENQDDLYVQAVEYVLNDGQASISYLQRKLKIGYSRAARIIDMMEEQGIIGPHEGTKPRKLAMSEEEIKEFLQIDQ